jgi:peptidoglycan/LPS O-acetylase OafA/YrhL
MFTENNNIGRIKEIDGLRGVAILIIVMSHFDTSFFQSGGVNIFFVITGFFITKIISEKGVDFSIVDFYISRVNSLYPQLLFSTILIFNIYLIFGELEKLDYFFNSFLASISSTMNLYLIGQENVYSNQSYINLFLPLWAFSVIFQFYILYPIALKLIFLLNKFVKLSSIRLFYILIAATIFSYFSYIYFLDKGSEISNFYSPFSRLWQFLIGGASYYLVKIYTPKKNLHLAYIGILLLVIWQFDFNQINFVYTTTIISFSAVLVILGSAWKNPEVVTIFSLRPLVQVGKISYPFYLWHMPLIYFLSLYFDEVIIVIFALVLGFFFALCQYWINYKIVITPLSKIKHFKYTVFFISISIALFALNARNNHEFFSVNLKNISSFFEEINLQKSLETDFQKKYSNYDRAIAKDANGDTCQADKLNFQCVFNVQGKSHNVILLGTSHLAAISQSLKDELVNRDHPVTVITASGCPYLLNFYSTTRSWCNVEYMEGLQKFISKSIKPSIIIIFTRYAYYIDGKLKTDPGYEVKEPLMTSIVEKDITIGFKKTYKDLIDQGHKLVLIYPVPESNKHVPRELRKKVYNDNFKLDLNYNSFLNRNNSSFAMLDSIESDNVFRFYPHKTLCKNSATCITSIGDKILYNDFDHLSRHGGELISPLILKLPVFNYNH